MKSDYSIFYHYSKNSESMRIFERVNGICIVTSGRIFFFCNQILKGIVLKFVKGIKRTKRNEQLRGMSNQEKGFLIEN